MSAKATSPKKPTVVRDYNHYRREADKEDAYIKISLVPTAVPNESKLKTGTLKLTGSENFWSDLPDPADNPPDVARRIREGKKKYLAPKRNHNVIYLPDSRIAGDVAAVFHYVQKQYPDAVGGMSSETTLDQFVAWVNNPNNANSVYTYSNHLTNERYRKELENYITKRDEPAAKAARKEEAQMDWVLLHAIAENLEIDRKNAANDSYKRVTEGGVINDRVVVVTKNEQGGMVVGAVPKGKGTGKKGRGGASAKGAAGRLAEVTAKGKMLNITKGALDGTGAKGFDIDKVPGGAHYYPPGQTELGGIFWTKQNEGAIPWLTGFFAAKGNPNAAQAAAQAIQLAPGFKNKTKAGTSTITVPTPSRTVQLSPKTNALQQPMMQQQPLTGLSIRGASPTAQHHHNPLTQQQGGGKVLVGSPKAHTSSRSQSPTVQQQSLLQQPLGLPALAGGLGRPIQYQTSTNLGNLPPLTPPQ